MNRFSPFSIDRKGCWKTKTLREEREGTAVRLSAAGQRTADRKYRAVHQIFRRERARVMVAGLADVDAQKSQNRGGARKGGRGRWMEMKEGEEAEREKNAENPLLYRLGEEGRQGGEKGEERERGREEQRQLRYSITSGISSASKLYAKCTRRPPLVPRRVTAS